MSTWFLCISKILYDTTETQITNREEHYQANRSHYTTRIATETVTKEK